MTARTRTAEETAQAFARQEALLLAEVAELNEVLGLTDADHSHKVTHGYIGNAKMGRDGWDMSDVLWSVYLPHPGRVGKDSDRVGAYRTGSLDGIVAARRELLAVIKGARLARSI